MYEFENSIFIKRPPQDVFDVIANPAKQKDWQSSIESAEWTSAGPAGVGSILKVVGSFLGRKIESELQITAWEPPHTVSLKSINGPFPVEIMNKVEPQGEGTLLTSVSRAEFGGFFKLAEGLAGKQIKKQVDGNYATLKQVMESNQL